MVIFADSHQEGETQVSLSNGYLTESKCVLASLLKILNLFLSSLTVLAQVLGNTFQIKGPEIIRSLPHIINVIQTDIEQFILPSKVDHDHYFSLHFVFFPLHFFVKTSFMLVTFYRPSYTWK